MKPVLEVDRLRKEYGGLRPLRLANLSLAGGARLAILGLDGHAAEALVRLITAVAAPDEGTIRVCGRDTSTVNDPQEWIATLDQFGLLSPRAPLIDELTAEQALAMTETLSIDTLTDDHRAAVVRLAVEAGLPPDYLATPVATLPPELRARCHLARALAHDPVLLLVEHGNALTTPADAPAFGRDIARVAEHRKLAVLVMTADEAFAHAAASRVYVLDHAGGQLHAASGWRGWFR